MAAARDRDGPAGRRRRADDDFVGNRPQHRLQLVDGQELQVGVRRLPCRRRPGRVGAADRVLACPAAIDRVLARSSAGSSARCGSSSARDRVSIARRQRFDVSGRDVGDRQLADTRRDVDALHRLAALQVGAPSAADSAAPGAASRRPHRRSGCALRGRACGARSSASCRRRNSRSACARVRPSPSPGVADPTDLAVQLAPVAACASGRSQTDFSYRCPVP